jgi:hypothetical protein
MHYVKGCSKKRAAANPYIQWFDPRDLLPPHTLTREDDALSLAAEFHKHGWNHSEPALVGYHNYGAIQLLSGTHRCYAARLAGIQVPVVLHSREIVALAYGDTEAWTNIMDSGSVDY